MLHVHCLVRVFVSLLPANSLFALCNFLTAQFIIHYQLRITILLIVIFLASTKWWPSLKSKWQQVPSPLLQLFRDDLDSTGIRTILVLPRISGSANYFSKLFKGPDCNWYECHFYATQWRDPMAQWLLCWTEAPK